jgi:hypothetical protein
MADWLFAALFFIAAPSLDPLSQGPYGLAKSLDATAIHDFYPTGAEQIQRLGILYRRIKR